MALRLRAVSETLIRADATGTSETLTFASCCGELNHITWVLVGFSRSRLAFNHASMSTGHAVRRRTAISASPAGDLHACLRHTGAGWGHDGQRPGPAQLCTERTTAGPVRTPNSTDYTEDSWPLQAICCVLSVRNDCTQSWTKSVKPKADCRRSSSMEWLTQSKTAERYSSPISVTCWSSAATRMSDQTRCIAVSVEWYLRYADWKRGSRSFSARYWCNWLVTTRSTTFEMNDRLDTGRKLFLSGEFSPVFFRSGVTIACFWETGSRANAGRLLDRVNTL